MTAELDHIKTFLQKNLEPCYYEIAEEQMLINPICGVIQKLITESKLESERIRKEKMKLQAKNEEIRRKAEEVFEKETIINEFIDNTPALKYLDPNDDIHKIHEIKRIINQYFDIDVDRKTRQREVVYARQIAMHYSRILTEASLETIGSWIAGRDHATVLHACRTIENLKRYPLTQKHIKELNEIFNIKSMNKEQLVKYEGKKVMLRYKNKIGRPNNFACNVLKVNDTHIEIDLLENYHKILPIKFTDIKEIKAL